MTWFSYFVECADGTLYAGITTGLARRMASHNRGVAARYTRGRCPVRLRYVERHPDRATASRREWQLKRMSRAEKCHLIAQFRCAETSRAQ